MYAKWSSVILIFFEKKEAQDKSSLTLKFKTLLMITSLRCFSSQMLNIPDLSKFKFFGFSLIFLTIVFMIFFIIFLNLPYSLFQFLISLPWLKNEFALSECFLELHLATF